MFSSTAFRPNFQKPEEDRGFLVVSRIPYSTRIAFRICVQETTHSVDWFCSVVSKPLIAYFWTPSSCSIWIVFRLNRRKSYLSSDASIACIGVNKINCARRSTKQLLRSQLPSFLGYHNHLVIVILKDRHMSMVLPKYLRVWSVACIGRGDNDPGHPPNTQIRSRHPIKLLVLETTTHGIQIKVLAKSVHRNNGFGIKHSQALAQNWD